MNKQYYSFINWLSFFKNTNPQYLAFHKLSGQILQMVLYIGPNCSQHYLKKLERTL